MRLSVLGAMGALLTAATAQVNSTFTPARPPAIPLAVKNPYFNVWLPGGDNEGGGYLPGQWPTFWRGQFLGWTGLVRVDGKTFGWMGDPNVPDANQTSAEFTATSSIFKIRADEKVEVKVTFLSPITPKDFKRQSLVFSYMNVEVSSIDGSEHDVQIYTDITAEWVSGDLKSKAEWNSGSTEDGINYHKVWKQTQQTFTEVDDRAEWGDIFYATESIDGLTYQSGSDVDVRGAFSSTGKLENSKDTNFRAINDAWPTFGYAIDLGSVGSKATSSLFSIGLCQDDAIQFLGKDDLRNVPSLWKSLHNDELDALSFFHKDFSESSKLSKQLDDQISKDSKAAGGDNYAILTTLATRQAFGATQLVGTSDKHYLFLKEISSNGNTQTIDVIYPATPIFLYTNPELVKLLLDPHFENQENGHYPNKYAEHDLGTHYPNATGHKDGLDEAMPVEECGNNIIMVLAYVQRSGDTDYIKAHYPILKQWAEYLIQDSLLPAEQLSTDDFAGHLANQTNLALKGIIGLEAMSKLSRAIGETSDSQNYTNIAHDYITKWQNLGINQGANPKHATLTYNNASTHGLLYNLYNDRLLDLNLVPQEVYDMQSAFYLTIKQKYGVPLDTRNRFYTKGDWEMFCAAIAGSDTQKMIIDDLAKFVKETNSHKPFSDLYQTDSADQVRGIEFNARPVVGGMFALLMFDSNDYKAPAKMLNANGTKVATGASGGAKDVEAKKEDKTGGAALGVRASSGVWLLGVGVVVLLI